jgi:hypothetical protein
MTNTASLLGISPSTLSTDLQSGDNLSSLASTAGVSSSDLLSAVEQDMSANAPSGVSAPSSDQLSQVATDFIDGVQPGAPGSSSAPSTGETSTAGDTSTGATDSNTLLSASLADVFA